MEETVANRRLPVGGLAIGLEQGLEPVGTERARGHAREAEERAGDEPEACHDGEVPVGVGRFIRSQTREGSGLLCERTASYGRLEPSSLSSSSSWMMIRGVTISIRLSVVRPMPTFLKSRLM